MILVGITGVVGSGKSTVSGLLKKKGFYVIDLDQLAREVTGQEETIRDVAAAFGMEYAKEGGVDRDGLKEIVFRNKSMLKRLEEIVHPRVLETLFGTAKRLQDAGVKEVIVDGPILYETGLSKRMNKIVVVSTDVEKLKERLKVRGMEAGDIERRLSFQIPLKEKEKMADYVVFNNGTVEDLNKEVAILAKKIKEWEEE
jgi:dephospho-CoA kinase